jgi:hypothetical protein
MPFSCLCVLVCACVCLCVPVCACGQIPNPLFDLAGAFSGFLLVPFWTFFLATAVGKAVNKVTLQVHPLFPHTHTLSLARARARALSLAA